MKKAVVSLIPFLFIATGSAQAPVEMTDWPVPWEGTRPRDPYIDTQGLAWFCAQSGNYIAYLEPETGEFTRFELPPNTNPHNLIVDDEGLVWFAGNRDAYIGKLDPATGDITRFEMPDAGARDPHTLAFGTQNDIWFTVQQGNFVGRLAIPSGEVSLFPVPTPGARPYGIKITPENRPWIVLFGTNKLATIDPASLVLQEVALPRDEARPRRLEITSEGNVWYVDYAGGFLGRYAPATGAIQEWPLPGGLNAKPYGTALDHLGRIWIAETGDLPNRLIGFDPATESFFTSLEITSGGSVRHMYFHPESREIWFGTDTNYLVKVALK